MANISFRFCRHGSVRTKQCYDSQHTGQLATTLPPHVHMLSSPIPTMYQDWSMKPIEYGRSDSTSLPRFGYKRHCGFCITPLGVLSWRKPAAMFWGHSGSPRRGLPGKGWRPPLPVRNWGLLRQPQDESISEASLQSHRAFRGPRLWGMLTATSWDPDPEPPAKLPLDSWLSETENKCL